MLRWVPSGIIRRARLSRQIDSVSLSGDDFIVFIALFRPNTIEFVGVSGALVEEGGACERVGREFLIEAEFFERIRRALIFPAVAANGGMNAQQANSGALTLIPVGNPCRVRQNGTRQFPC